MWETKQCYTESKRKGISFIQWRVKDNWIGHISRMSCLLKHVIEGKVEGRTQVTGRRGRRCKQLLDYLKEMRGYWKLKEGTLDRGMWRTRCERAMDLSYDIMQNGWVMNFQNILFCSWVDFVNHT
jgi:hypothetical protein